MGFSIMWTKNFQMYKVDWKKAEEPEIKLPTCGGPKKKEENSRKKKYVYVYFCFIDYAKAFDCADNNKLCKILRGMEIPDHLTCLLWNLYKVKKQ